MDIESTPASLSELRARQAAQRQVWDGGDYVRVADTVIPHLGSTLVDDCGIGPGTRVLDIAAGAGNASLPAARQGGRVIATDLSDSLLAECGRRAGAEGLDVRCVVADAEALQHPDATFDAVISCVGVMFAPRHEVAADEMLRVCRPGGRLGLLSWTPQGFVGQMLTAMRPFVAAPLPGAQPPTAWGDPEHLRQILGERVINLEHRTGTVRVDCFTSPEDFRDFFKTFYGPTLTAYQRLGDDPGRRAALDHALDELAAAHWDEDGTMRWEYLLVRAFRTERRARLDPGPVP